MPTKEEILEFLRSLKPELESFGIKKVGLFGSYAKDKANIASDIDVVIESSEETIQKAGGGIKAIIYLEGLRSRIMKRFKISANLCDTASMSEKNKDYCKELFMYSMEDLERIKLISKKSIPFLIFATMQVE